MITNSTRRFLARPRRERLEAMGWASPKPLASRRPASTPAVTRMLASPVDVSIDVGANGYGEPGPGGNSGGGPDEEAPGYGDCGD